MLNLRRVHFGIHLLGRPPATLDAFLMRLDQLAFRAASRNRVL